MKMERLLYTLVLYSNDSSANCDFTPTLKYKRLKLELAPFKN